MKGLGILFTIQYIDSSIGGFGITLNHLIFNIGIRELVMDIHIVIVGVLITILLILFQR